MPGDCSDAVFELGVEQIRLVAMEQVFKRIKDVCFHTLDIFILRVHQRQFLLEHQRAGWNGRYDIPAFIDQPDEFGDVGPAVLVYGFEITLFQLGHAATFFLIGQADRNLVVLEDSNQVLANVRGVHVAVAGGKQGHFAPGRTRGNGFSLRRCSILVPFTQRIAVKSGEVGPAVHAQRFLDHAAHGLTPGRGIHRIADHRQFTQVALDGGVADQAVTEFALTFLKLLRLASQHEVWKVDIPFMRRDIGALGLVTQVTHEAFVDDFPVIGLGHTIDLQGL